MDQLDAHEPGKIAVRNPATGNFMAVVADQLEADVVEVVAKARAAQPAWAATPIKERGAIIRQFAHLMMQDYQEELIQLIRGESGKTRGGGFAEVMVTANVGEFYASHAPQWLKPSKRVGVVRGLYGAEVHYKPLGVVGCISPWNFPLLLPIVDMIPALIAGNAVVLKPSEIAPLSASKCVEIFRAAGLPDDVFQVVTGYVEAAETLIDHVDYVQFTGSTAVGRKVAARAAQRLIPYSLELGGNDPLIVLPDANLEKAAAAAVSTGFENAGQVCISTERVIVVEPVYEQFLQIIKRWHARVNVGTEDSFDVHMGSITNPRELERTREHIHDALEKGARLIAGGNSLPEKGPLFHEPTILADVTPDMHVFHEETFGPIIAVMSAQNIEEAIAIANNNEYGLSASIWSKDVEKAKAIAQRIESGDVVINATVLGFATPTVPSGGVKNSGVGRRNGKEGLLKYTQMQSIVVDRFPQMPDAPTLYTKRIVLMLKFARRITRWLPFLKP